MDNAALIEFLSRNDETFCVEDNVHHATRAFIIRSIIDWCSEKRESGEMSEDQVEKYMKLIHEYLKNKVILFWMDDSRLGYTVVKKKGNENEDR
jgi:hypothetical protein